MRAKFALVTLSVATTTPVRAGPAEITGMRSQLRRLLFSNPLASIAFECAFEGVHAATTTGREIFSVPSARRSPLLTTAIRRAVVAAVADFAVATGIAVVVCGPGWLLPFGVADPTVSTTPVAV
jgi:hypothetical protein